MVATELCVDISYSENLATSSYVWKCTVLKGLRQAGSTEKYKTKKWVIQKNKDCYHHHSIDQERSLNLCCVCVGSRSILKWSPVGHILKASKILQQIFSRTNVAVTQTQYPQLIRKRPPGCVSCYSWINHRDFIWIEAGVEWILAELKPNDAW